MLKNLLIKLIPKTQKAKNRIHEHGEWWFVRDFNVTHTPQTLSLVAATDTQSTPNSDLPKSFRNVQLMDDPDFDVLVTRILGGVIPMELRITQVDGELIHCGWWQFDRDTFLEIDEDLDWDKSRSGSYLMKVGDKFK